MPFFIGRIFIVESISGIVVSVVCADNNFFTKLDGFGGDSRKAVGSFFKHPAVTKFGIEGEHDFLKIYAVCKSVIPDNFG